MPQPPTGLGPGQEAIWLRNQGGISREKAQEKQKAGYAIEYDVTEHNPDGSTTKGRSNFYKRECFGLESRQSQAAKAAASQLELAAQETGVIEKKKTSQPVRGTGAWDDAMVKAHTELDLAVNLCYRPQAFTSERQSVDYLSVSTSNCPLRSRPLPDQNGHGSA